MRVLAFDQSVTSSAAVLLREDEEGVLSIAQTFTGHPSGKGIHRMMDVRLWMHNVFAEANPDMVARELHNMRQFGAAGQLQALTAILDMIAYENDLLEGNNYAVIAPGTWKKFCLGKGTLKKDTAYMMHINKFIQGSPLLHCPDGFEVVDDNLGDAICIGVTAFNARQLLAGKIIHASKESSAALLKVTDNMFDHGKS